MKKSAVSSMRDRVRKRAETRKSSGGLSTLDLPEGVELFKPEKGSVEFDIVPYRVSVDTHPEVKKGELWYERTYLAHRNVGPDEQFLVCPRTIGKRCPICEEHQKLKRDPNAEDEVVDALRAKERELFNVVLKDGDGSVMVLDISTYLFGRMLEEEIRDGDLEVAGFAELKGGKTLKVRWVEKKMGKQAFVEAGRIDFIDRDDLDEDETLDAVVDLDRILKILSYEEIEKIFQAGAESDDDGKDDDSDDDDGDGAGDEDDPPPRRVIGKGKKKPAEDDDGDDDGDDAGDDDPPPKGKKPKVEDDDDAGDDAGENVCIACDGTGKTSKGKVCPICDGTGKDEPAADDPPPKGKKDDESEDDDANEDEADDAPPPKRRVLRR